MGQSTSNARDIKAGPEEIYKALTDPAALVVWQVPGNLTARIHSFDARVGGGYQMSIFYPENETDSKGKTSSKEDRFTARFVELIPGKRIVEAINFETSDAAFAGEMIMEADIQPVDAGTRVTFVFRDIPPGIKPEDNEAGANSSLEKLAGYVEG